MLPISPTLSKCWKAFLPLALGVTLLLLLSGCSKAPAAPAPDAAVTQPPAAPAGLAPSVAPAAADARPAGAAPSTAGGPASTPGSVPAPGLAPAGAAPASAAAGPSAPAGGDRELIEKLLTRIEQLEQKEGDRGQALTTLQQQHQKEVEDLLNRIHDLEQKVDAKGTARVVPELVVPPQSGPTTEELDQKIRVLERKNELAAEDARALAATQPRLTIGPNGASFSSADSNFVVRLKGVLQLDSRNYIDDNKYNQGNDGFVLRRARPILEGTLYRDFDFQFVPDFGGSSVTIFDANFNYRLLPELQIKAGKYKSPVGLEQLMADANLLFNERALPTALVPNRNVGVELWGEAFDGALSYAGGVFNNTGDGRNANNVDFGDSKEFAGRIFGQPFKNTQHSWVRGLGFGVGGSYSDISSNSAALPNTTGGTLPGYWTAGQQQWFAYNAGTVADGPHWRVAPQGYYLNGPFGIMGEYTISDQGVLNKTNLHSAHLENHAWQVSAQWVLTGEDASFSGIIPKHPFNLHGDGWGAWQLVARYGQLSIDHAAFPDFSNPAVSANEATEWAVGLNWWLNRNVRLMTSFSHTTFDGGGKISLKDTSTQVPPATVSHQDENTVFTRLQLAF